MTAVPTVCILAGGFGTRLGVLVRDAPKPLIEVAGDPFRSYELRLLAADGAHEIVLCVGCYLAELIERRAGTERFGPRILYSQDEPALNGTLGTILRARAPFGEGFLVPYGDTHVRSAMRPPHWRASAAGCRHDERVAPRRQLRGVQRDVLRRCCDRPRQARPAAALALGSATGWAGCRTRRSTSPPRPCGASPISTTSWQAKGSCAASRRDGRFYETETPQPLAAPHAFLGTRERPRRRPPPDRGRGAARATSTVNP